MARKTASDVRDINLPGPENINPRSAPVDSYVRPAQPQSPSLDLVKALGSFSGELRQLGQTMATTQAIGEKDNGKPNDDEVNKLIGQYRGLQTPEERKSFVQQNAPLQAKFKEHGLLKLAGMDARDEMDREYEAIKSGSDPATFDAAKTQAELQQKHFGSVDHPAYRAGFNARAGSYDQKNITVANAEALKRGEADRDGQFMQTIRNEEHRINSTMADNTPEERAQAMRKGVLEKMQFFKDTRGLERGRAMSLVGSYLDELTQKPGNEVMFDTLTKGIDHNGVTLETQLQGKGVGMRDRAEKKTTGDSEEKRASYLSDLYGRFASGEETTEDRKVLDERLKLNLETPQRALSLRQSSERAQAERVEASRREFKQKAESTFIAETTPALAGLAHNGQLYKVQEDEALTKGDITVSVKRDTMREAGLKAAEAEIIASGSRTKALPEEVWAKRLRLYEKNGTDHPVAKDLAEMAARTGTGMDGETVPQFLVDNWPLLQSMKKSSPRMYGRLFTGKDREFMDTLDIAADYAKKPDGSPDLVQAMRHASWVRDNQDKMPNLSAKSLADKSTEVIKKLSVNDPNAWYFTDARATDGNRGLTPEMQGDIDNQVKYLASRGAQGDKLTARVAEAMRQNYALAGGRFVNIKDTGMAPKEAEGVFGQMLEDYKAAHPQTASSAVTVRRDAGRFYVADESGMPISGQSGHTVEQVAKIKEARERTTIEKASGEADAKARGSTLPGDGYEYQTNNGRTHKRKLGGWLWQQSDANAPTNTKG